MEDDRKKQIITFRVSQEERQKLIQKSGKEGKTLSDYIRERVLKDKKK